MSIYQSGIYSSSVYSTGGDRNTYFAADEAEKTVDYLQKKGYSWFDSLNQNRYLDKIKRSWQSYHGAYYEDGHSVNFGGEVGEITNLPVNHFRNIAQHILTMITATRPSFQARSTNTDYKSQSQTILANGLLEYYMRTKRLEKYLKTAVEYAVSMGSGYIKMDWNATSGEIYDYIEPETEIDEETGEERYKIDPDTGEQAKPFPIYEGDVEFTNLSPFDVVYDGSKESPEEHDWVLTRTFKNKFDLIAKYPEYRDQILNLETKNEAQKYRITISPVDETVDLPVYEFYHKRTESLPNGRYIMYLATDIVLMDTAMPYRQLPVYAIRPSHILGTPYGYTPMFDLLPLQDAVNSLYSTVLTNQNAFGVQNILNPRGNDVRINQFEGGMNFIEYNPVVQGGANGEPKPLNLTNTPAEIFNFMNILVRDMETISGINSVVRGNPEESLRSGNALALVQSQALQFINGLQQSYIMLIEDIGTGIVQLLQDFAKVPRVAEVVGKANKPKMVEFSSDDIDSISRVLVDVGNTLANSTAGRVQMADNLIQMGIIKNPEEYFSVLNTGRLENMTQGQVDQNLLIKAENERLVDGTKRVNASAIDAHSQHIREHMNVLADPDLRLDQDLSERVLAHIMEHINLLGSTDPNLLMLIGEQPLGPQAGSPIAPGSVPQPDVNQAGLGGISETMQNAQAATTQAGAGVEPAEPPVDPLTGLPLNAAKRPLGV